MKKADAILILCRHAAATMPEGSAKKLTLYDAMATVLPPGPEQEAADHIAFVLAEIEQQQLDFTKKLGV